MSTKADRKRHNRELKQKAKRKEERKKRLMVNRLKYSEYLMPFFDVIYRNFNVNEITLFRWMHNPEIPDDFLPQIFQENDPRSVDKLEIPDKNDPDDIILHSYIDYFTFSNFDTLENAEREYLKWIERFSQRKKPDEKIKNWIENKGLYIEKINYKMGDALIGKKDENGHIQTLIAEDIDPETLVDRSFEPYKIDVHYEA